MSLSHLRIRRHKREALRNLPIGTHLTVALKALNHNAGALWQHSVPIEQATHLVELAVPILSQDVLLHATQFKQAVQPFKQLNIYS